MAQFSSHHPSIMAYAFDEHGCSNTAIYFYHPQISSGTRSSAPASHVIPPPAIAPSRLHLGQGEIRTANLPTNALQKLPTTPPPTPLQESRIRDVPSLTAEIKCILDSENSIEVSDNNIPTTVALTLIFQEKRIHGVTIEALADIEGKLEETNFRQVSNQASS